ncbi:MAG: 3-hydroxyacyl-CoA dehydrogenase NAD-binding domain-containing protein [Candidatus Thorarchaeota archaeon]
MIDISKFKEFSVIGAGTMGREIAQVAIMSNQFDQVKLWSRTQKTLDIAANFIETGLKKLESKGLLGENSVKNLLEKLVIERNFEKASKADFIVESVPEFMDLKQSTFKKLGNFAPEHTILATNTSTMSITEIASTSGRPDKVVGMHFFIPIPVLELIELIRGKKTSDETFEISAAIGESLPCIRGKKFVARIEKESPGFIVNRLTIASGVYIDWLTDIAMEKVIKWKDLNEDLVVPNQMGLLAKRDYLGLDVIRNAAKYFEEKVSSDFAIGKALTKLIDQGNLGRKTGKGYLDWTEDGRPITNGAKKANLGNMECFMALQMNEGCRLLEEGIVSSYEIIDKTMIAGMRSRGPFELGMDRYKKWCKLLDEFADNSGKNYFRPTKTMQSGDFLKYK